MLDFAVALVSALTEVLVVAVASGHKTEEFAVQDSSPSYCFHQLQHSWHFEPDLVSVAVAVLEELVLKDGRISWYGFAPGWQQDILLQGCVRVCSLATSCCHHCGVGPYAEILLDLVQEGWSCCYSLEEFRRRSDSG